MAHCAALIKDHFREDGITGHAALRVDMPGRPFASFLGIGLNDNQTSGEFREKIRERYDLLRLGATTYTSIVLSERSPTEEAPIVSTREAHVLTQLARGLSPQEIAEADGRSLTTIRHQIASARSRLGARSATHAVARALELGLIRT